MRLTGPEPDSRYNNKTNMEHVMKELSIEEMTALRGGFVYASTKNVHISPD